MSLALLTQRASDLLHRLDAEERAGIREHALETLRSGISALLFVATSRELLTVNTALNQS
jgi:hypothetical protein